MTATIGRVPPAARRPGPCAAAAPAGSPAPDATAAQGPGPGGAGLQANDHAASAVAGPPPLDDRAGESGGPPWLLALHSSGETLGVGLQRLGGGEEPTLAAFPLGRGLSGALFSCIEAVLPAALWPRLGRLAVAIGPGGFTGTRLTVTLARTLAQQLELPLDGVGSFQLIARRLLRRGDVAAGPFWVVQELPRRGLVAGLYAPLPEGDTAELLSAAAAASECARPEGLPPPPAAPDALAWSAVGRPAPPPPAAGAAAAGAAASPRPAPAPPAREGLSSAPLELAPPRLYRDRAALAEVEAALLCGSASVPPPRCPADVRQPDDVAELLCWSQAAAAAGLPAPWASVLPLYPTSPVDARP